MRGGASCGLWIVRIEALQLYVLRLYIVLCGIVSQRSGIAFPGRGGTSDASPSTHMRAAAARWPAARPVS